MLMLTAYKIDLGTEKIDSRLFGDDSALYEYLNSLLGPFPRERIQVKKKISNKDFPILFSVPDDNAFFYEIVEL